MTTKRDHDPLRPGQCAAIIESADSNDGARHFSMQRIIIYGERRCSRKATEKVVHLDCCTTHARLAREGLVAEDGRVLGKQDIRGVREGQISGRSPGRYYTWAPEET